MIFTFTFEVKPDRDAIIPPFTSKLSRSIFLDFSPTYSKFIEAEEPYKPFRITVLKDGNTPVYSKGNGMVTLTGGKIYNFSVTTTLQKVVEEVVRTTSIDKEIFNAKFHVELVNMEMKEELGLEDSRLYKVLFNTPTLLQPPRPKFKRKENRFILFPYVPSFFYSLSSHWNKFMSEKIVGVTGSKTLYYFREVDYNIRPVTTYYGKTPTRGFIGWVLFELRAKRNSKIRENVRKLLDYANYFGVGKSRSIGFGEVKVLKIE
ncbi:CRISPR-associated protein, Cas6 [Acidianus hospitalis W1]|uniref:CRISPR-associated protein, Cas6 n=1 Tax=Acidianus hospitalis (strain W1) TaxID=933801 RepID=F4B5Q5_ACIHW|nr:CRISPR-associated endoribonuclease Cas6 [Acidianus hospitalis]AEE93270.1 CRISPR-associated protein, Cas6 [Acidianus hospitalis W1]